MRAKPCTGSGGVGLDGVSLVEKTFLMKVCKKPPKRLNILILIGNIGVIHIYPVTHLFGKLLPLCGILHYLATAGCVVFGHTNGFANTIFGNAKELLYTQLYG